MMTLADLRKFAIKQQTRIRFQLQNGMECVVTEHGIAQVPSLRSIPDFNLELELASAREFLLDPPVGETKKPAHQARPIGREELAAMLAGAGPVGPGAHNEREED